MQRREWLRTGLALTTGLGLGYGAGIILHHPPRHRAGFAVSQWQQSIDWRRAAATRPAFVYLKATEGIDHLDRRFLDNLRGATAHSLPVGAYHYFRADRDPVAQARWFETTLAGTETCLNLIPAVDVEHIRPGQSDVELSARLEDFLAALEPRFPELLIYTTHRFATRHVLDAALARLPLWLGDYESALAPRVPPPWTDWTLWQYTESAAVDGVPTPCTRSLATAERLARLARPCG